VVTDGGHDEVTFSTSHTLNDEKLENEKSSNGTSSNESECDPTDLPAFAEPNTATAALFERILTEVEALPRFDFACQCCGTIAHLTVGPSRFGDETWACEDCWRPDDVWADPAPSFLRRA
jgi:hypothetical protein